MIIDKICHPYRLSCKVWIVTVEIVTQFKAIGSVEILSL